MLHNFLIIATISYKNPYKYWEHNIQLQIFIDLRFTNIASIAIGFTKTKFWDPKQLRQYHQLQYYSHDSITHICSLFLSIIIRRIPSSGMLHRAVLVRIDVSEEYMAFIFRVRAIGELETTLAVTSN
jgi:hypothetical protein